MSEHAPPDHSAERSAIAELSRLIRALGDELAGFRKRALAAEARVRGMEQQVVHVTGVTPDRVIELERENAELQRRVTLAQERTERMLMRVRFLRQQREGMTP